MIINVAPLLRQPVGTKVDHYIAESPIDPHGENADLLDAASAIDAELTVTHTNPGAFLEGEARADIEINCSRCLRDAVVRIETQFAEQYYAKLAVLTGDALPEAPLDAKTIGSDYRIDLTPLLREELILATPQAPLCRPDCKGLCPDCGEDLNERPHVHEDAGDPRWAELRALREFHPEQD